MRLTVATYFWSPDPGSKFAAPYTPDDVRLLQRMVFRSLSLPHKFVVVTDQPEAFAGEPSIMAVRIDRTTHVPGTCFVRLMTFHPDGRRLFLGDKVLQLDLDTIIVGNIDHLVTREEDLVLWRNPARIPWDGQVMVDGVVVPSGTAAQWDGKRWIHHANQRRCYYNTSILFHKCGTRPQVWQGFDPNRPPAKDDQWYLSDLFGKDCPYFDGARDGVYRIAREDTPGSGVWGDLPANACVVTCPGSEGKAHNPRVAAANPWIAEHRR